MTFLLKILMHIVCLWSNFYQKLELRFMKRSPELLEKFCNSRYHYGLSWKCYVENLVHYGCDKWYMLWDVMSRPDRFMYRGEGDCDDFARLGVDYFGKEFLDPILGKNSYVFDGFYYFFYGLRSGHVVAIWKCEGSAYYFRVDNKVAGLVGEVDKHWQQNDGQKLKYKACLGLDDENKLYFKWVEKV